MFKEEEKTKQAWTINEVIFMLFSDEKSWKGSVFCKLSVF